MLEGIRTIVIAGAGVMGSSMAQLFAKYGYNVILYVRSEASERKSRALIDVNQQAAVDNGESTEEEVKALLARIRFSQDKGVFASADFVIEAILEDLKTKQDFFAEISELVSPACILTSNTSGLSLTQIAETVKGPERFCGMHWLNPPHIIPLIEIIKAEKTADETAKAVYDLAVSIERKPVILKKEVPGFLVNRFQFAVLREAMSLVEEGVASPEDIDKVFKYGLGIRYACLGPFEIADLGGLDTFYRIASYLFADLDDRKEVNAMLADLYEKGEFGVKSLKGYYDYSGGRDKEVIAKRDTDYAKVAGCLEK